MHDKSIVVVLKIKKMNYKYIILLLYVLVLFSCNNKDSHISNVSNFKVAKTIDPTISYIDSCNNQVDIVLTNKYYIIQSEVKGNQNQLYVYDKKNNNFLYSFAMKGHGNMETIAMDMIQTPKGDTLEIIDQAKYKIMKYCLKADKAELLSSKILKYENVGPLQEVYRLNDSIIVFNTLNNILCVYNDVSNKVVSEYNVSDSIGTTDKDIANFHFALHDKELCIGFRHINAIVLGKIGNDGKIVIDNLEKVRKLARKADNSMLYYVYVNMNKKNIVAQYMGYAPGFIKKMATNYNMYAPKFELEIYSTSLVPLKHITLSTDMLRCKTEMCGKKAYTWNPLELKTNIIQFDI